MAFIGNQIITLNSLLDLDGQELVLDADADSTIHVSTDDQIDFKIGGTDIVTFTTSSGDFEITQAVKDKDIIFKGDDNGSAITALTLDMSEAGAATFNSSITATSGIFSGDLILEGTTADSFETTFRGGNPSADITITLPTQAGTVVVSNMDDGNDVQLDSLGLNTAASGTAGELRATNDITAFYSSDIALKENIVNIPSPMDLLSKINGVLFDWKQSYIDEKGGEDGYFVRRNDVGVIAQEVEKVMPEIVATRKDGIKAVKYDRLTALLIEAVKDLQDQIIQR